MGMLVLALMMYVDEDENVGGSVVVDEDGDKTGKGEADDGGGCLLLAADSNEIGRKDGEEVVDELLSTMEEGDTKPSSCGNAHRFATTTAALLLARLDSE